MGILDSAGPPVPVTVIGGFLGAGKTTLLNHILRTASGRRIAVLVNDFGAVSIDGELIVGVEGDVITMANGCLCCTIKNDVVGALLRLIERKDRPEHVVIETSGISNPGAVVDTFLELQRAGAVRLDGVVVVVDAENFMTLDPKLAGLAKCQVQAADVVVINKTDLVPAEKMEALETEALRHAPGARLVRAEHGAVPIAVLLAADDHDHGPAHVHAEGGDHGHDHGFVSWRFTTLAPMRFRPLADVLKSLPPSIYRVKGFLNLAERPGDRVAVHVVGKRMFVRTLDAWGSRSPKTDLVFIAAGDTMNAKELEARLEACIAQSAS